MSPRVDLPLVPSPVGDDEWLEDRDVTVRTYAGETSDGSVWADPVTRRVGVEEKTEVARDSSGEEVTIGGRLFARLELLADLTVQSLVDIRPGRTARVVGVEVYDAGGELADVDHLEVLFV